MRTVHETEALRPSDPVPKNYNAIPPKPQRLKLIVNAKPRSHSDMNEDTEPDDDTIAYNTDNDTGTLQMAPFAYPSDVSFTDEELATPPDQLYRLLRRQIRWTEEDAAELRDEIAILETKRKEEWLNKELVLANVMEAELAYAHDRGESIDSLRAHLRDLPQPILPMDGPQPWYRQTPASAEEQESMEVQQLPIERQ